MRGGGLYARGFAVTFLWLEAGSVIEDFKQIHLLFDGDVPETAVGSNVGQKDSPGTASK